MCIGAAVGAAVSLAVQGVAIATGKQESMNWGAVAGAAVAGAAFGGLAAVLAPAGMIVSGLVAGAVSGQAGIATEAVVNEALTDGTNFSATDALDSAVEDGLGDPLQMGIDGAAGVLSLGVGNVVSKGAASVGLLPETTIARGVPMIKPQYVLGGRTTWTSVQRTIVGPTIAPPKWVSTATFAAIEAIEDFIRQSVGGHAAE
jgi:hypothetical protein